MHSHLPVENCRPVVEVSAEMEAGPKLIVFMKTMHKWVREQLKDRMS